MRRDSQKEDRRVENKKKTRAESKESLEGRQDSRRKEEETRVKETRLCVKR